MKAAGIIFITQRGLILFCKRGDECDHPGEWAFPGGKLDPGETVEMLTAVREAEEETGRVSTDPQFLGRTRVRDTEFALFTQEESEPFMAVLNWEHSAFAWAGLSDPPEPLHPGVRAALRLLEAENPMLNPRFQWKAGDLEPVHDIPEIDEADAPEIVHELHLQDV